MKLQLSNIDVFAVAKEINDELSNGFIDNVYEVEDLLILKIRTKEGNKNLVIKDDSRINLTAYDYPVPKYPSQYCISLRKFLKNRKILRIYQHKLDRILLIEISSHENAPWRFLIELFAKGNYILIDDKNLIKVARRYKKFKDRDVLAKREYVFPPSRGIDLFSIDKYSLTDLIKSSKDEIVRIIARNINIAGQYSEEICRIADIDKTSISNTLSEVEVENIFKALMDFAKKLESEEFNPQIIFNEKNEPIDVVPFDLSIYEGFQKLFFDTFNKALDEYFSKLDSSLVKPQAFDKLEQELEKINKRLKIQLEYIKEQEEKKKIYYKKGDLIYKHFDDIDRLLKTIQEARKKKYSWKDIQDKLLYGKEQGMREATLFEQIIYSKKEIVIEIDEVEMRLNLNKSVGENANDIYSKGKKAQKKIDGTRKAIEETKKKIEEIETQKLSEESIVNHLVKKPKKKWYEKYRWFFSSDDFLVVGGRDASSNEVIYKKYIEPNDLILHSEIRGSPLALIKNPENKNIPDITINEAAIFVGCYSRAWKEGYKTTDVFYVKPDQISKTPPSGEYLPKGSFIITGKKNYIYGAPLELAIGLNFEEIEDKMDADKTYYYPRVISGPTSVISKTTKIFRVLIPERGGKSSGNIAKEIKSQFLKNINEKMKKWVKILKLDDIILLIPSGDSKILIE